MSDIPEWEKKEIDKICELYISGISAIAIAKMYGRSKIYVYRRLRIGKVQIRGLRECQIGISRNKGTNNPMYGKTGSLNPMYGVDRTEMVKKYSGVLHPNYGKRGPETFNWKNPEDRRSATNLAIRSSKKYYDWRLEIFKRDKFTCQFCGDSQGGNLNVDHIKQFALILQENNIKTLEQGFECKDLWDKSNGRTLCIPCHKNTDSYGKRL